MRIAVTGSVASDHLMTFPGRFADEIRAGSLESLSLSFLVDDLVVRRGGTGANIAYVAASLGVRPALVASVGADFVPDGVTFLRDVGVDTKSLVVSETRQTARFVGMFDSVQAQLAAFYTGAMAEARDIDLAATAERLGGLDVVIVAPDDPEAMHRHADACRSNGWALWADPGWQMARFTGEEAARFCDGATYLFTNAFEAEMVESKTGRTRDDVLDRVGVWVVTRGGDGVDIRVRGRDDVHVPAVPVERVADPTGAGDAFRGGFVAAHSWGLPDERAAMLGATAAAYAVETVGPQDFTVTLDEALVRLGETYGAEAAGEIRDARAAAVAG